MLITPVRAEAAFRPRPFRPGRYRLPAPPSRLLGRERLLENAGALLRGPDVRLLTLLGPGGAGKTRLAIELAESLQRQFDDGACFVDLSEVRDARQVTARIARALGSSAAEDSALPLETVLPDVETAHLLLVLDNFEHVLPAAHQVAALLERCPGVKVLATSRSRLCLRWERVLPVPPLDLPGPAESHSVAAAGRSAAVRLFVERAQAAAPSFRFSAENATAIAEVCALLDGLPLAIEHAAGTAGLLSPQAMARHLRHRLDPPAAAAVDLPLRQQSLRNAVAWSFNLLPPHLKTLFARLAVFDGGCTLAAAEAVCRGDDGDAGPPLPASPHPGVTTSPVLTGMLALVDRSLLCREEQPDGEPRFRLLETIRTYSLELLAANGEQEEVCRRHAAYFLDLAERVDRLAEGPHQAIWLEVLARERRNLGAALSWSIRAGDVTTGLGLSAALWRFWRVGSTAAEARGRLAGLLVLIGAAPKSALLAAALLGAGVLAERAGERGQAQAIFERSLAAGKRAGERLLAAHAQSGAGRVLVDAGEYAAARALCEHSLAQFKKGGDQRGEADALGSLGLIAQQQGDRSSARSLFQQSLHISQDIGDMAAGARALLGLGRGALFEGELTAAEVLFEQSQVLFHQLDDGSGVSAALIGLAQSALQRDDLAAARSLCAAGLSAALRVDDRLAATSALLASAALAAALSQPKCALHLAGAAAALRAAMGRPLPANWQSAASSPDVVQAQQTLGQHAADAAYAAGRILSLEQAAALAFALAPDPAEPDDREVPGLLTGPSVPSAAWVSVLTRREREIVVLIAQGFTNRRIAAKLVVSERTVDTHVEHILKKLKVRTRAQVAVWAVEQGLIEQNALASRLH